jgi:E3 ubiquitin-protein ligase RNF139
MSWRTKMLGLVDVFMRVPPLFILDEILKINLGLQLQLQPQQSATTTIPIPDESPATTTASQTVADLINSTAANILNASHNNEPSLMMATAGASEEDLYKYVSLSFIKFFLCLAGRSMEMHAGPFHRYMRP